MWYICICSPQNIKYTLLVALVLNSQWPFIRCDSCFRTISCQLSSAFFLFLSFFFFFLLFHLNNIPICGRNFVFDSWELNFRNRTKTFRIKKKGKSECCFQSLVSFRSRSTIYTYTSICSLIIEDCWELIQAKIKSLLQTANVINFLVRYEHTLTHFIHSHIDWAFTFFFYRLQLYHIYHGFSRDFFLSASITMGTYLKPKI